MSILARHTSSAAGHFSPSFSHRKRTEHTLSRGRCCVPVLCTHPWVPWCKKQEQQPGGRCSRLWLSLQGVSARPWELHKQQGKGKCPRGSAKAVMAVWRPRHGVACARLVVEPLREGHEQYKGLRHIIHCATTVLNSQLWNKKQHYHLAWITTWDVSRAVW